MSRQTGVMIVSSKNSAFAQTLSSYALVQEIGSDFSEKHFPSLTEAVANGQLTVVTPGFVPPPAGEDQLEGQQRGMAMIHAREAQQVQAGNPAVRVGVLDSGIDGNHVDFEDANGNSNVDCQHGADFTTDGPGVGSPLACVDNNFHGTHVAGISPRAATERASSVSRQTSRSCRSRCATRTATATSATSCRA